MVQKLIQDMQNHKRNFKSIGALIAPLVKRHGQVNIISYSKLFNLWETIVGEDISKKAHPIKIKAIKGGEKNILFLGMNGPYLAELSLQVGDIIEKINSFYSKEVIVQIKLKRVHMISKKNVVELDNLNNPEMSKNEELSDPALATIELENAIKTMKNNLCNSRKRNETMED